MLDEVGFDEELRLWLSRLGEAETEGDCADLSIFSRLFKFSISLCRVRRVADPYKVNSHKLPHKPRAVSSVPTRFAA